MERKEFLKLVAGTGLTLAGIPLLFSGCASVHRVSTSVNDNKLTIAKWEFTEGVDIPRNVVVVKASSLDFPIALYRVSEEKYIALWMECTHQGCEVNVQSDYLVCPCHGSEYDVHGNVVQGPAESNLTSFKVYSDHENIYINL